MCLQCYCFTCFNHFELPVCQVHNPNNPAYLKLLSVFDNSMSMFGIGSYRLCRADTQPDTQPDSTQTPSFMTISLLAAHVI